MSQVNGYGYVPTAIVFMNSRPPFSQNTLCCLPDWSPSILITSSFVFGERKRAKQSNRSVLDSIIGPVTSSIARRKYLRKSIKFIQSIKLAEYGIFISLIGVHNVFASTSRQYIQLWLILSILTWAHFDIVEQPVSFLPAKTIGFVRCCELERSKEWIMHFLLQESHIYWTAISCTGTRIT